MGENSNDIEHVRELDRTTDGLYGFAINKGLDKVIEDSWEWFKELRTNTSRNHVVELAHECDELIRRLFPDRELPYYVSYVAHKMAGLYVNESVKKFEQMGANSDGSLLTSQIQ